MGETKKMAQYLLWWTQFHVVQLTDPPFERLTWAEWLVLHCFRDILGHCDIHTILERMNACVGVAPFLLLDIQDTLTQLESKSYLASRQIGHTGAFLAYHASDYGRMVSNEYDIRMCNLLRS